ncbi:MAG: TetR family transcriptional regulator [Mycobacterium sp.]|jgi:AcrR family transcriptional regulator|nr:TetR family transcriptional regulator [Mycobacterium sp.]
MAAAESTAGPVSTARPTGRDEITDAVLDAAERLFAAAGPNEVSLRAIAQEAGVTYGLVYRHFGTKDALLERLLTRYAERWRAHLGNDPDYASALRDLLGASFDAGAYLRLLAWTLLTGEPGRSADSYGRQATLDELPPLAPGGGDARLQTAGALAFAFGWHFFNPFIRAALHLEDESPEELQDAIRAQLQGLIDPR